MAGQHNAPIRMTHPAKFLLSAAIVPLLLSASPPARAEVRLPHVFGSHMVLQQGMPVPVWGWADPGEKVTVRLDDRTASAEPDAQGAWRVILEPLKADGRAHSLTVSGKNTVTLEDVLIGEVWIGSGQSNMDYGLGKEAGARAAQPEIRLLSVPPESSKKPVPDVKAEWQSSASGGLSNFSAVLYYFGQNLHGELKVPVGLIKAARGSTAIERFLPPPKPGDLYNGTIAPLQPFAMRGVIWYQGEANRADGLAYAPKQRALIEGWRKAWGREFPFYLVQIAPFTGYTDKYDIPSLWEAQLTGLKMPHVGVAVINDTAGQMANIHPGNKDKVGQRLAAWALAGDYGRTGLEYCSPMYKAMQVEGGKVRLFFSHARGLKTSDGKPPTEFTIAGADGKYVPARATIDGETVVVEAAEVAAPVKVRYAWRNTPAVTLVNGAGLPSSAFHSDDWQGGTAE